MARDARPSIPQQTLVVDPGAYTLKAGLVARGEDVSLPDCQVTPNCIAHAPRVKRTYIGSALAQCPDYGELQIKRPVEKGFIVNWDLERAIFEHEFFDSKARLNCDPSSTSLLLCEPPNSPANLSSNTDQIIFEEFSFAHAARVLAPAMNALNPLPPHSPTTTTLPQTEILLLIDSSHSSTTLTPLLRGRPINAAVRRIGIGGKHISNYLAELISLRHFGLIDEPWIVAQIKEDACFVSGDFAGDLERTWKGSRTQRNEVDEGLVVDYVLPDYEGRKMGEVRRRGGVEVKECSTDAGEKKGAESEEVFPLANERFVAPELLFNPLDVGCRESGIPETAMQCLAACPPALWHGLLGNVVCVGGNTLLPGFVERVETGLRALAPVECEVRVRRPEDPITATWQGAARLAADEEMLRSLLISREDYFEHGEGWVKQQFATRGIVADWSRMS